MSLPIITVTAGTSKCLRGFLFLWVLGMGYVILLWNSLSLPYNYFEFASWHPLTIEYPIASVSHAFSEVHRPRLVL